MGEQTIDVDGEGGGFRFSPAELESVLARWERLHADLLEDHRLLGVLMEIQGPGAEFASEGVAERANASGRSFVEHHEGMVHAVRDYIERLKAARESYRAQDESAGHELTRQQEWMS